MPFRGWVELDGTELANSSRVIEHVGVEVPTKDLGILSTGADCSLVPMLPNRVVDPWIDPTSWASFAKANTVIDTTEVGGGTTLRMTGIATAGLSYAYFGPDQAGGGIANMYPAVVGEQWYAEFYVYALPTNTAPLVMTLRAALRNSTTQANPFFTTGPNVSVAPGQRVKVSISYTVPNQAGYDRLSFSAVQAVSGANQANQVVHINAPEVNRLLDTPMPGMFQIPSSSVEMMPGIWSPPDGSRLWGPGLYEIGACWDIATLCRNCRNVVDYDDSWPGLAAWLGDVIYRPEIAPWYSSRVPESAEFGGVWIMDIQGLDVPGIEREITEMAGDGGAPGPARTPSRQVTFDAVLLACTNAGLTYGLEWLTNTLRATNKRTDATLRYLTAHPGHSAVDPDTLVREVHGVVLTDGPSIRDSINAGNKQNQQATAYRVSFTLTVTRPHAYSPPVSFPVVWDTTEVRPISWVHAADCRKPADCADMPVMFSQTCDIETIEVMTSPPPSCGGCMPVGNVTQRVFTVPTFAYPMRAPATVVDLDIRNTGGGPLTLQAYWRICDSDERCDDQRWPLQVSGLPAATSLHLDGVSSRYWVDYDDRRWRPAKIVSTFSGVPWRPPVIDRATCWEFVVISAASATFEVTMTLRDRDSD